MPGPVDECYRLYWTNSVPLKCKRCTNTIGLLHTGWVPCGQSLREGLQGVHHTRAYIVPRPRGLGRVQVSALSFGSLLHPGAYLGLHPTLGKKSNQISVKTFFLLFNKKSEKKICASLVLGHWFMAWGPNKIWGPGIDLRTPWKNFSLRPCLWLGYVPLLWCLFHTNLLHQHFFYLPLFHLLT